MRTLEGRKRAMNCVSLVCTVHKDVGLANVSALYAILGRIQPAVIFLEVPPAALCSATLQNGLLWDIAQHHAFEAYSLAHR
jgi:hypothetical protein